MAKVSSSQLISAVHRYRTTLDNPGFCLDCGAEVEGVEPDTREAQCESCGEHRVFGAEELLLMEGF